MKSIYNIKEGFKDRRNVIYLIVPILVILAFLLWNNSRKQHMLDHAAELTGTITGIRRCARNGFCFDYEFEYKNKSYQHSSRTNGAFYSWCRSRNDCKGLELKVLFDTVTLDHSVMNWKEFYKNRNEKTGKAK